MPEEKIPHHGKQNNQKMKPYLVLQYLLRESDENNVRTSADIEAELAERGITAERRSIYRDIDEINKANLMIEEDCSIDKAEERLAEDDSDDLKLILYDKSKKGFYIRQRHFDLNDIRLLAECVYSAKFVSEGQAQRLVDVVCEFVSESQAERIRHNAFLTDRVKTHNKSVLNSISTINEAMSRRIDGQRHEPEKISFKYLKNTIDDVDQQIARRHGETYTASPYQLLINDGNYYLLAFSDRFNEMRTYRVDRMKDVRRTGEKREGFDEFAKLDMRTYSQRVFSMFGGKKQIITLRFHSRLLDTIVERFGTKGVQYSKMNDWYFKVTAEVEISDQFYGWLLGLGKQVKILYPDEAINEFKEYMDQIRKMYEKK